MQFHVVVQRLERHDLEKFEFTHTALDHFLLQRIVSKEWLQKDFSK